MPKEEAIVVTSPRETSVPEFNKKEIEAIVNSILANVPSSSKFNQISVGQYFNQNDGPDKEGQLTYFAGVRFDFGETIEQNQELIQEIKNSDAVIFTMNNTFVFTPIAKNGDTLSLGSFAMNYDGDTRVARLRFVFGKYNNGFECLKVKFDDDFKQTMALSPYAALITIKF